MSDKIAAMTAFFETSEAGHLGHLKSATFNVQCALEVAQRLSKDLERTASNADVIALAGLVLEWDRVIFEHNERKKARGE